MLPRLRPSRLEITVACAVLVVAAAGCASDSEIQVVEGVIDRETFVEVYVDLRAETVQGSDLTLSAEQRDSILTEHGVDGQDLLDFVDAYGRDLDFMNQVWADVEQRLEALPPVGSPRGPNT